MIRGLRHVSLVATALLALLALQGRGEWAFAGPPAPPGNTQIVNAASATWQDNRGDVYHDDSNPVTVTVQGVSALTVTPKETAVDPKTDGYPAGQKVTRTFVITNQSNIADAYRITNFTAGKGSIDALEFLEPAGPVPVKVGTTVSSMVQPGGSITVRVVLGTAGIAVGTSFALQLTAQTTVKGTANGLQSDSGEQWLLAASTPSFSGPGGPDTPIQKTVNQQQIVQSQAGATVTFQIAIKNSGGSPATHTVLTDTIPDGLTALPDTTTLNGKPVQGVTLSGQTLTVPLGTIDAGQLDVVSFNASVENASVLGESFVNLASVSADGVAPISTTPATVFIGTADVVFDPADNNHVVSGATVSLLDANGHLVPLGDGSSASSVTPFAVSRMAANTQNPYTTGPDGTYGFALSPKQIAAGGTTFYLQVATPGYLNRRIQMLVTPTVNGQLYSVTATSQDGQPLAAAGSYTLTTSSVALRDVFGLFGNIPLFKSQTITISKTVNTTTAQPGDRLIYTIDVSNPSSTTLGQAQVVDTIPAGESYAPGTARLDGAPLEPAISGRTLTWSLPPLAPGVKHELIYAAVVFPSVPAGTMLTNSASANAVINGTHVNVTASSNAEVEIVEGPLSDRSVITGRVFLDVAGTGHFARGDRGIAGVRVYLEDGSSALTDSEGRFNFPAVRPGMHVLRVDPTTLPDGIHAETRTDGNRSLQRLIHGLLDEGLMQDVEFALGGGP